MKTSVIVKTGILFFAAFFWSMLILGQATEKPNDIQKTLDQYNDRYQPEYAELSFDKDFYFSGDKIWYSLRLWNDANAVSQLSVLAYVEIRDSKDSILIRQKIKCKLGKAYGELSLPEIFPTGYYKISAFTSWMRNSSVVGSYEQFIPVINREFPVTKGINAKLPEGKSILRLGRKDLNSVDIGFPAGTRGRLVVFNYEEVLLDKIIQDDEPVLVNFKNNNDHSVSIVLFDNNGHIVDKENVVNENLNTIVKLTTSGKDSAPRSSADVFIELTDREGNPIHGNVSVSVRSAQSFKLEPKINNSPGNLLNHFIMDVSVLPFKKEIFIYPASGSTLQAINFSSTMTPQPNEFLLRTSPNKNFIEQSDLIKKINSFYSVNASYLVEDDYNMKSNNSFEVKNYATLPTVEEFFREVVPQVKIRKKELFVRNSDNPAKIYFFNEPALILVDKLRTTSHELLNIPLSDIERIDVIWSMDAINKLGVFDLADNGVVSITTKSRVKYSQSGNEIFKGLHIPLEFSIPKPNEKEKTTPVFCDPLYWNPSIEVEGKARVTIKTSDELGLFRVEVKGLTETGDHISGTIDFKVSADPD